MTRSWCISQKNQVGFEQMLKFLMNLLIFPIVNTLSWGHSTISLSPNDQNSSLVGTCSILVALSHQSNVQNFTSTPPPTSSNQFHKYQKMFSCIFLMPLPPSPPPPHPFLPPYPVDIYLLKINNRNTRTRC